MITYSIVRIGDITEVAELFLEAFSSLIRRRYSGVPSHKAIEDIISLYSDAAGDGFIVAREGKKVVGFIIAVENLRKPWGALFTKQLLKLPLFLIPPRIFFISSPTFWHFFVGGHIITEVVSPEFKGKGIGAQLASRAVKYLEEKGVKRIYFETEASNEPIKQIYSKLGFKQGKKFKTGNIYWLSMFRTAGTK